MKEVLQETVDTVKIYVPTNDDKLTLRIDLKFKNGLNGGGRLNLLEIERKTLYFNSQVCLIIPPGCYKNCILISTLSFQGMIKI